MKKEIDKDLFKRVTTTKKPREFSISERKKSTNKYQTAADFVASQTRTKNTKGQESELADNWGRFSASEEKSVAAKSPTNKVRSLTAAHKAQVEAHKLAKKRALKAAQKTALANAPRQQVSAGQTELEGLRPSTANQTKLDADSSPSTNDARQANMGDHAGAVEGSVRLLSTETKLQEAGHAHMGHGAEVAAGSASLAGDEVESAGAGHAQMGHHEGVGAGHAQMGHHEGVGAGHAQMGHHEGVGAGHTQMGHQSEAQTDCAQMAEQTEEQAGLSSLAGEETKRLDAGEADLGHQKGRCVGQAQMGQQTQAQAGSASLQGADFEVCVGMANMGHHQARQANNDNVDGRQQGAVQDVALEGRPAIATNATSTLGVNAEVEPEQAAVTEESALSSRLAEKMSKIRSKSADITMDTEALQERNDKS